MGMTDEHRCGGAPPPVMKHGLGQTVRAALDVIGRRCYAYRYPDLLRGYCDGDVQKCEAGELTSHYEQSGQDEGRQFLCKTQDAMCCEHKAIAAPAHAEYVAVPLAHLT